jgi:hypothetical protein
MPALVDYVLSRIPVYTLHITVGNGGSITFPGLEDTVPTSGEGLVTVVYRGSGSISLEALANKGFIFQNWVLNDQQPAIVDNPLTLTLNDKSYPGVQSESDIWGNRPNINLSVVFFEEPAPGYWKIGLGYAPYYIAPWDTSVNWNSDFHLLGAALEAFWLPFQGNWGAAGLNLGVNYVHLVSKRDAYNVSAHFIRPGLQIFYETPLLWGFLTFGARAGGGASLRSGLSFQPPLSDDKSWKMDAFISGGAYLDFYLSDLLYLTAGADYQHFLLADIYGSFVFNGGLGLRF